MAERQHGNPLWHPFFILVLFGLLLSTLLNIIQPHTTVGSHVVFQPCNPYVMKIPETSRGCFDIYMDPKKPPMTLLSQLHPL